MRGINLQYCKSDYRCARSFSEHSMEIETFGIKMGVLLFLFKCLINIPQIFVRVLYSHIFYSCKLKGFVTLLSPGMYWNYFYFLWTRTRIQIRIRIPIRMRVDVRGTRAAVDENTFLARQPEINSSSCWGKCWQINDATTIKCRDARRKGEILRNQPKIL